MAVCVLVEYIYINGTAVTWVQKVKGQGHCVGGLRSCASLMVFVPDVNECGLAVKQMSNVTACLVHMEKLGIDVESLAANGKSSSACARLSSAHCTFRRPQGRKGAGAYRGGRPPTICFKLKLD